MNRLLPWLVLAGCAQAGAGDMFADATPQDYRAAVANSNIPGITQLHLSGSGSVGTTEEIIGNGTTLAEALPQTGEPITCVSTDATDTAAGAGARSLSLTILDNTKAMQTVSIAMAGLSATTATTENVWRVLQPSGVDEVGTYGASNAGVITCTGTPSGDVRFVIAAGAGDVALGATTVPAGMRMGIVAHVIAPEGGKTPTVRFWSRENNGVTVSANKRGFTWPKLDHPVALPHSTWETYGPGTDLWYSGVTTASTDAVDVELEGFLYPE